tara:strand:- start:10381 stop:10728 length:348 start_codon:yes stop_codon:yes gene_type:complete
MDVTEAAMSIASLLANANVASIHARYPDTQESLSNAPGPIGLTTVEDYVGQCVASAVEVDESQHSAAQMHGLISCLDYQSCEVSDWDDSKAGLLLADLVSKMRASDAGYVYPSEG